MQATADTQFGVQPYPQVLGKSGNTIGMRISNLQLLKLQIPGSPKVHLTQWKLQV